MDEDDTQHLDGPMAVLLTAAVALTVVVALMALVALTGCVAVVVEPELVRPGVTVERPVVSTTQDGDSKDAQISVPAQ